MTVQTHKVAEESGVGENTTAVSTSVSQSVAVHRTRHDKQRKPSAVVLLGSEQPTRPRAKKILCVDLTGNHLKYSLFSKSGESVTWLMAGRLPELETPQGPAAETLSRGIEMLSPDIDLKGVKVLVIIPGLDFFLRLVEVPILEGNDLIEAVKWECSKQVPYAIEGAYVNILGIERVANRLLVQTGVTTKPSIDAFAALGDRLLGVVPSPLSLYGSTLNLTTPQNMTYILINWGESEAVIAFAHGERFEFCKSFGVEGLLRDGLVPESPEVLERVKLNLHNSLDFYNAHFPDRETGEIKVYGLGSRALIDELSRSTDTRVGRENPYVGLISDKEALSRFWNDCEDDYILCSGAVKLKSGCYFLPVSLKQLLQLKKIRQISNAFSFLAITALLLFSGVLWIQHSNRAQIMNSITKQIMEIERSPQYLEAVSLQKELDAMLSLRSELRPPQPWVADLLKAVSVSVPPEISLQSMDLRRVTPGSNAVDIRIDGHYYGSIKRTEVCFAELVENLRNCIGFEQKRLDRLSEKLEGDKKHSNFALTGQVQVN